MQVRLPKPYLGWAPHILPNLPVQWRQIIFTSWAWRPMSVIKSRPLAAMWHRNLRGYPLTWHARRGRPHCSHLNDLLGDGKPEARTALGLGSTDALPCGDDDGRLAVKRVPQLSPNL